MYFDSTAYETDHRMKMLVVDDHVLIRELLRGVLTELSPEAIIVEGTGAQETMRLVAEHQDLTLILLDLNLPDGDGFEVLTELRERHPTIPIVVLSGHHDRANVVRALELGALGFIPKTAQRPVLVSAIVWFCPEGFTFHLKFWRPVACGTRTAWNSSRHRR